MAIDVLYQKKSLVKTGLWYIIKHVPKYYILWYSKMKDNLHTRILYLRIVFQSQILPMKIQFHNFFSDASYFSIFFNLLVNIC